MNTKAKRIVFFVVLIGVAVLLWAVIQNEPNPPEATYSQFLQQVQAGQVSKATIEAAHTGANPVTYSLKDGAQMGTVLAVGLPRRSVEAMQQKLVNIEIRDGSTQWNAGACKRHSFPAIAAGFLVLRAGDRCLNGATQNEAAGPILPDRPARRHQRRGAVVRDISAGPREEAPTSRQRPSIHTWRVSPNLRRGAGARSEGFSTRTVARTRRVTTCVARLGSE